MIMCCGEALIDMLPRQLPDGQQSFLPVPGGSVYNTAVALGRLGEDVQFFSGISTDIHGEKLAEFLTESGVKIDACVRNERPTTLAFVQFIETDARYTFYDEGTAGRMLETSELQGVAEDAVVLHFGSISLISEPCGSTYEQLMLRHHEEKVISLDPNIRPGFVADENGYRKRLNHMIEMSDIVKISEEDLAWLEPNTSFDEISKRWMASGTKIVLMTLGATGSQARTPAFDVFVPAQKANVVDTVGAGDSFNAGFLSGLRRLGVLTKSGLGNATQEQLQKSLEMAARVSGYTVGQPGANPPWADQVDLDL